MLVLAIDPGPRFSAFVVVDRSEHPPRIVDFDKCDNDRLREILRRDIEPVGNAFIEEIASYGMTVGKTVFDTARWSGRFEEILLDRYKKTSHVQMIPRRTVKLYLCGTVAARDGQIRSAIIQRYGGKEAVGTKHNPGQLYGIANDVWQALGLALTGASLLPERDE